MPWRVLLMPYLLWLNVASSIVSNLCTYITVSDLSLKSLISVLVSGLQFDDAGCSPRYSGGSGSFKGTVTSFAVSFFPSNNRFWPT
jgi:hypothetical protein